jgi:hypothetical protein
MSRYVGLLVNAAAAILLVPIVVGIVVDAAEIIDALIEIYVTHGN